MNLLTIPLTLHVLTPVHIGCGQQLMKKEYIVDPKENRVYVLDTERFFSWLIDRNLDDAYFAFVQSSDKDLYKWLHDNVPLKDEWNAFTLYTVEGLYGQKEIGAIREQEKYAAQNKFAAGKKKKPLFFPIDLMMKDPYGKPYIPGSSLKGAIRTALLNQMISDCDKKYKVQRAVGQFNSTMSGTKVNFEKMKDIKRNMQFLEQNCFHLLEPSDEVRMKEAICSVMRGLSISDSEPLELSCLTLCRKIDYDITGQNPSYINLLRECLKPGTEVYFTLTLDQDILGKAGIDEAYIEEAIKNFYILQNQEFVSKFQGFEGDAQDERCALYLGGGCGFHSKTLLLQLLKEKAVSNTARLLEFLFPGGYHDADEACGASPHMIKGTLINNTKVLMGKCEVRFGG